MDLTAPAVSQLWECITMIEAQDQLNKLSAADWPNLASENRQSIHKDLFNKAFQKDEQKVTVVTQSELNRILGLK